MTEFIDDLLAIGLEDSGDRLAEFNQDELAARFFSKVTRTESCWLWAATVIANGYGQFWANGRMRYAHRVAYEMLVGAIPDGMQLDHLCRNRRCVNPKHLEPVAARVNTLRGESFAAVNAAKTHCAKGHAFDEHNTRRTKSGNRVCRSCNRSWQERYNRKRRAK